MSLSIGIVGLPNVGKSTLFNALTKKQVEASNYPFCTIDPNVGVVKVPDERLDKIAEVSRPAKILPTAIEFVDIAGLVSGAHKGEGLGNQFLSRIREVDAICEVVRSFKDDNVVHVHGRIDPESDKQTIDLELVMADLQSIVKQSDKVAKEAKGGDKEAVKKRDLLEKIKIHLDNGRPARELELGQDEKDLVKSFNLLTIKPIIYVINGVSGGEEVKDGIFLNVKQEEEIARLSDEEQKEYIKELGLEQSGLDKLIKASYELLGLITFFTTGTDETRAWTVVRGAKAPQAAGAIHTDFEKGFIRTEVMNWEKFIAAGSEQAAKEKGLMRTEGKDYVVQDGDICHFLFNK